MDIEKVNIGFMAVKVPGGKTSEIVFRYKTPGLAAGALASGCAVVIFVVYMLLWKVPEKRRRIYMCYCEDDEDISEDVIYPWDKEEPETESRDFELIPDEPPEIPRRPAKDSKPPEPEKKPEPENKPGPETRQEKAPEKKPGEKNTPPEKRSGKSSGGKRSGPKHMKKDPGEK